MRRFAWLFFLAAVVLTAYWTILSAFFPDRTVKLSLGRVGRELNRGTLAPQEVARVLKDPIDSLNKHRGWVESIAFAAPHANLAPNEQVLNDLSLFVTYATQISRLEEGSTDYQIQVDDLRMRLRAYEPPSAAAWSGPGQRNFTGLGCWVLWGLTLITVAMRLFGPPLD